MRPWLILVALMAEGQPFERRVLYRSGGDILRGAALSGPTEIVVWGERVRSVSLPNGRVAVLSGSAGPGFGEGGCLIDADRDGDQDVVLHELPAAGRPLGRMVWLERPENKLRLVDTDADFRDCRPATLHGQSGVLLIHRQAQVRFYSPPARGEARWPYRDIYSIYTPSLQGGLSIEDVDADGYPDVLCGNYWIRSPARRDHPWRLFAINNWWEESDSAMLRMARAGDLLMAQRNMALARLAWFEKPPDPTGFWRERRVPADVRFPRALAAARFTGDRPTIVAGENKGPGSRLLLIEPDGSTRTLGESAGFLDAWTLDADRDGKLDIITVGVESIDWWRSR